MSRNEEKLLYFVTGNVNKVKELNDKLKLPTGVRVAQLDIDLPEFQGANAAEIAQHKFKEAVKVVPADATGFMIEDTCMGFDVLGGLPGPYIKWFLKCGLSTLVQLLAGFDNKGAVATCIIVVGLRNSSGEFESFQVDGETRGTIVSPRGPTNFGWDPIFQPVGSTKTYAEMTVEEKNTVSHRAKAVGKLSASLQKHM